MKRFFGAIKRFFMPSDSASTLMRIIPLVTVAFVVILFFLFSNYAWETTNEIKFCGLTCHTMPPQYTTHQISAHASVACEDCHMGRGSFWTLLPRKIAYSWQTGSAMVTGNYHYPIVAKNMLPARVACENCHKPETFTADKLVNIKKYAPDEKNTLDTTYMALKTGGGTQREGLGRGIHWHIENPVYFYPTDTSQQTIPYVAVTNPDGSTTEYVDVESGFDPATIQKDQLVKMDCITCHNRTAHGVSDPNTVVDGLMGRGLVSPTIPNIKAKAVEVMGANYPSITDASAAIAALDAYYQSTYPDFYAANKDLVTQAIQSVKEEYANTNFPDQQFNWKTHPNNLGHTTSPGCMRCHDGKHQTSAGETVRLECNLCHTVPVSSSSNQVTVPLVLDQGFEPPSHKNTNWIGLHNKLVDGSCQGCHTTEDAGGTSNTSFCSNSICHGSSLTYAGYNAPKVAAILAEKAKSMITPTAIPTATPVPTATPIPSADSPTAPTATGQAPVGEVTFAQVETIFKDRCSSCHSSNGMKGLNLTTYADVMAGGQSGPVILPGDPINSLLVKVQSGKSPHFGQLSPEDLERVKAWILAGAKE